jgi:polyketide synthase PksJ
VFEVVATPWEKSIWARSVKNSADPGLVLDYCFEIVGHFDAKRIESAIFHVLETSHKRLVSRFIEVNQELTRQQFDISEFPSPFCKVLEGHDVDGTKESLAVYPRSAEQTLFAFALRRKSSKVWEFHASFSHLIFDGLCYAEFFDALAWAYNTSVGGEENNLNENFELVDLETTPESIDVDVADLKFWGDYMQGRRFSQELPFGNVGEPQSFSQVIGSLDPTTRKHLKRLVTHTEASNFAIFTAAVVVLLRDWFEDYSGMGALQFAHTASMVPKVAGAGGCHMNIIPMYLGIDELMTAEEMLQAVRAERRKIRPHQHVPFLAIAASGKVVGAGPNIVINESPGMLPAVAPAFDDCRVKILSLPNPGGPFDIMFCFNPKSPFSFSIQAKNSALPKSLLAAASESLIAAIQFVCSQPKVEIREFQRPRSLTQVAKTPPFGTNSSIIGTIMGFAKIQPEKAAVRCEGKTLSYAGLALEVRSLAAYLDSFPWPPNAPRRVGIFMGRSDRLVTTLLACLFSGITFVPILPSLPNGRIRRICEIAELSRVVVDDDHHQQLMSILDMEKITVVVDSNADKRTMDAHIDFVCHAPGQATYILFTSGSTGEPKGVMISHSNLLNFLSSMRLSPGLVSEDTLLAVSPIGFDISLLELLLPVYCGATIEIATDITRRSGPELGKLLNQSGATVMQATPSTWRLLQASGWRPVAPLRALIGGEAVEGDLVRFLHSVKCRTFNMYGPTEATIWCSSTEIINPEHIHLGNPVAGTAFHIVDSLDRPVPDGAVGELVVSGTSVGLGYLNPPADSGYGCLGDKSVEPCYHTGDLVRHDGNGILRFLGRRDSQIKLNGHRIELGEIDTALNHLLPDVVLKTVLRNDPAPHLAVFSVPDKRNIFSQEELVARLSTMLPTYSVPKVFHVISVMPLTANDKTDVRKLACVSLSELAVVSVVAEPWAQNSVAQKVECEVGGTLGVLHEVLDRDLGVLIFDADLPLESYGLNSLSFQHLSSILERSHGIDFPAFRFFDANTLNDVAAAIDATLQGKTNLSLDAQTPVTDPPAENIPFEKDVSPVIVGLSGLFPGGRDSEGLWESLLGEQRLICAAKDIDRTGSIPGSYLERIDEFDQAFFKISPREARDMDPRQRLLLQETWRCLENAGHSPQSLKGQRVGVYVSGVGNDYALAVLRKGSQLSPFSVLGTSNAMLANRLSFFFDWVGPSVMIDTACSGGLTAMIRAVKDLEAGHCDSAIVASANIISDPQVSQSLEAGRFLSLDGNSSAFSDKANGYIRGEGVVVLYLKRSADARSDGDSIQAVVESYAENHGGRAHSLTAPSAKRQKELYLDAYTPELAGRTSFIETHGTGTLLGDPIEIDGLKRAWNKLLPNGAGCKVMLGALKSSIGHLEAAAGLASVVKTVIAMREKSLPANLDMRELNSALEVEGTNFSFLEANQKWQGPLPLTAGISSFGFGGSNAHVVISSPEEVERAVEHDVDSPLLFVLSARTDADFLQRAEDILLFLETDRAKGYALNDIAFTLAAGRESFKKRAACICNSRQTLLRWLESITKNEEAMPTTIDHTAGLAEARNAFMAGEVVDWSEFFSGASRVELPAYRFNEKRQAPVDYRLLTGRAISKVAAVPVSDKLHPNFNASEDNNLSIVIPSDHRLFSDHIVKGQMLLPGSVQVWLVVEAIRALQPRSKVAIANWCWLRPVVPLNGKASLQVKGIESAKNQLIEVAQGAEVCSRGSMSSPQTTRSHSISEILKEIDELRLRRSDYISQEQLYRNFRDLGINYGSSFRNIQNISLHGSCCVADIRLPNLDMPLLPILLDCATQASLPIVVDGSQENILPYSFTSFHLEGTTTPGGEYLVLIDKASRFRSDIFILGKHGDFFASILDFGALPANFNSNKTTSKSVENVN